MQIAGSKFGEIIKNRRKLLRLNQSDLSEMSGVTIRILIQIESGKGNPSLSTLMKIANVLGMVIKLEFKNPTE